jgi:hypothetical protein
MPWECPPPPTLRIPGLGGAALTLSAAVSPTALDGGIGPIGVDIKLTTPEYTAEYRRRPVDPDFPGRLRQFLWSAASDFNPQYLEPFEDGFADLTIRVLASTDFTVTLEVEVVAHEDEDGDSREIDGVHFETTRAALITASERAEELAFRDEPDTWRITDAEFPLDLLFQPETNRLSGIYRLPTWLYDRGTLAVTHLIRYDETAQVDVEASFLTSLLPFATAAAHGVDESHQPWVIVTQVLPEEMATNIAAPWDAALAAREEINKAVAQLEGARISGESTATHNELIGLLVGRGVDRSLVEDWTIYDLCLAGMAELTNAPLAAIAQGRLTGCAFPDVPHDCPKDVWDCTFTRWQEDVFNKDGQPD